jgi:hypothetical protein
MRIDLREPADQGAFDNVVYRDKTKQILDTARENGSQSERNGCGRQIQVGFNGRDGLPRNARAIREFALRETLLRANRFQVIGKLNRVCLSPCLNLHGGDV